MDLQVLRCISSAPEKYIGRSSPPPTTTHNGHTSAIASLMDTGTQKAALSSIAPSDFSPHSPVRPPRSPHGCRSGARCVVLNSTAVANRVVYMEYTPSYPEREGSYLDHLGAQHRPTLPSRPRYGLQRSNRYRCDASSPPIAHHHLSYPRELPHWLRRLSVRRTVSYTIQLSCLSVSPLD